MKGRQFDSTVWDGGAKPPVVLAQSPARAADLVADLFVPLGQAIITGVLLAGVGAGLGWLFWPDASPVRVFAALAVVLTTAAWLALLAQTRQLLWMVERAVRADLDGDGSVGRPLAERERLVVVNAPRAQEDAARRAAQAQRSEFVQFVAQLEARGTSQRAWESLIGREKWAYYRDTLIRLGWADWNVRRNGRPVERRGWRLTVPVEEILSRIGE